MQTCKVILGQDNYIYLSYDNPKFDFSNPQKHFEIGYIQYTICTDDFEVNIPYIFVHPYHRGHGYGTRLFKEMFQDVCDKMRQENLEIFDVLLDDMSDRYGKKNNLYLKMGFDYCEKNIHREPVAPEMCLTIHL